MNRMSQQASALPVLWRPHRLFARHAKQCLSRSHTEHHLGLAGGLATCTTNYSLLQRIADDTMNNRSSPTSVGYFYWSACKFTVSSAHADKRSDDQ